MVDFAKIVVICSVMFVNSVVFAKSFTRNTDAMRVYLHADFAAVDSVDVDKFSSSSRDRALSFAELSSKGELVLCVDVSASLFRCAVIHGVEDFRYNYYQKSVNIVFVSGSERTVSLEDLYASRVEGVRFVMAPIAYEDYKDTSLSFWGFFRWIGGQMFWEHAVPEYEDIKKAYKDHQERTRKMNEPRMRQLRREALSKGHGSEDLPKMIQSPKDYWDYIEVESRHYDDPLGPPLEMMDMHME